MKKNKRNWNKTLEQKESHPHCEEMSCSTDKALADTLKDRRGGEGQFVFPFLPQTQSSKLHFQDLYFPAWKKEFHVSPENTSTCPNSYCFLSVARAPPLKSLWCVSCLSCGVQGLKIIEVNLPSSNPQLWYRENPLWITPILPAQKLDILQGALPASGWLHWSFQDGNYTKSRPQQQRVAAPQHFVMKKDMVLTGRNLPAWRNSSTAQWWFLPHSVASHHSMQKRLHSVSGIL